jgi:hypothetical protein
MFSKVFRRAILSVIYLFATVMAQSAEYTTPQSLAVGDTYKLLIDGFTGDEASTEPKTDANNGLSGDNPYFQRYNIARAHNDYWYTSKYQEAGEPDPAGPQWVDYKPPLSVLNPGRYHITTQYRDTDNRTNTNTPCIVTHAGGTTTIYHNQSVGDDLSYYTVDLGEYDLGSTGWVRIQDPGALSVIGFHWMKFTYLGPSGPVATFTAMPSTGEAPLTVSLNASASSSSGATITSYAWDFTNDGTIDETNASATTSHVYAMGTYQCRLQVTDSNTKTGETIVIIRSGVTLNASTGFNSAEDGAYYTTGNVNAQGTAVNDWAGAWAIGSAPATAFVITTGGSEGVASDQHLAMVGSTSSSYNLTRAMDPWSGDFEWSFDVKLSSVTLGATCQQQLEGGTGGVGALRPLNIKWETDGSFRINDTSMVPYAAPGGDFVSMTGGQWVSIRIVCDWDTATSYLYWEKTDGSLGLVGQKVGWKDAWQTSYQVGTFKINAPKSADMWVDNIRFSVTTPPVITVATNPSPANNATSVDNANVALTWTAGDLAQSHKVYLGTSQALVTSRDISTYKDEVSSASYNAGALTSNTEYFWAVDEVNTSEPGSPWAGPVWSFRTNIPVGTGGVAISSDKHWIQFRGKKTLLIGDSVTQGWMEGGANFNSTGYLDALSSRGINMVMLWSYMGTSSAKQIGDARIGYDAPEYCPWNKNGNLYDLNSFNTTYFTALENFIAYADNKDMVVLITIHDGWPKDTLFQYHPFNSANGGPLTSNGQYVELADYNNEMPTTYNAGWTRQQKNQYFQERFTHRLIEAVGSHTNVIFEIFNEGDWYNQTNLRAHQVHFLNYIKARTSAPTMVNDDHVTGTNFRGESNCDIISYHRPNWDSSTSALTAFDWYDHEFIGTPAKPFYFSEPVPEWQGDSTMINAAMRLMWGTAVAGAGFVLQNDTSFGWDPYTAMAAEAADRNTMYDRIGHCARFFDTSLSNLGAMVPNGAASSSTVCLASVGNEYVVYSQSGSSFTVNLSAASGKTLDCRFYNPYTGAFNSTFQVAGGNSAQSFTKPSSSDWVLHILAQVSNTPIIAEVAPDPDSNAFAGVAYTKQLQLSGGQTPVTWSIVQGPSGLQVDSTGLVSGWTPEGCDAINPVTIEIRAENSYGSDTETWVVAPDDYYMTDNLVNITDLLAMAEEWLADGGVRATDLDCSGSIDLGDFAMLAQIWMEDFTPVTLEINGINPSTYVVQYDSLAVGQLVYTDRSFTFSNVATLAGSTYVKTSNEDKDGVPNSSINFTVNLPVIVYVAHDDTITTKPAWLSAFTDTGANLITSDNNKTFSLYAKHYPAGPVSLGANGGGVSSSMYSAVIVPQ